MSSTSYDLISLNGYSLPDVMAGKGEVSVRPNPKFKEYEAEDGTKTLDVQNETMVIGTVGYNGLLQTEVSAIYSHLSVVSTMTIYNPATGATRTFLAKIIPSETSRIIHDAVANAWTFSFDFEEIGSAT